MRSSCDSSMYWCSSAASARGRGEVVPEGLLDHHTRVLGEACFGEPLHHATEQERRDLEVEDRVLGTLDRLADALVGARVAEVAGHIRQAPHEASEHLLVELLARRDDRRTSPLHELLLGPVVDGDPHDRALEQLALLEPVQRPERHHLREIPRDPEDHEHITPRRCAHSGHLRSRPFIRRASRGAHGRWVPAGLVSGFARGDAPRL